MSDKQMTERRKNRKYDDGRTKQAFKEGCDINKLLSRAQIQGGLSHLEKYEAVYGDFSDFDFYEAQLALARGKTIFQELPSEIRTEFNQSPAEFFAYVNDPENAGNLHVKLPELAAPGRQRLELKFRPDSFSAEPGAEAPKAPEGAGEEPPAPGAPGSPDSPPSPPVE